MSAAVSRPRLVPKQSPHARRRQGRFVVADARPRAASTSRGSIALVGALADRRATGVEIVLVSSGAIAAGLEPLGLTARPRDLATQQAAASVGQGLLVHRYTEAFARPRGHRRPGAADR